jgi:hypothetical protein
MLMACGPAEASYEGNTATASQNAGGEFSPSGDEAEPGDDTSPSPSPATTGSVDAGSSTVPPLANGQDAASAATPPPATGADAGDPAETPPPVGEVPPPEFCPDEVCDGVDNDCDGQVDEGLLNVCGTCGAVPQEVCNNGRDDDCDGRTDCADTECGGDCVVTCEETEGHNCNTDMGYGDRCAPSDNTGGCTSERFWAWCNRRNAAYPDLWDNYLREWVDERCDNSILLLDLDSNNYDEFACTSDEGVLYRCTTPLVVALDPEQPVAYEYAAGLRDFDLSAEGDGSAVATAWPTSVTPWLALDRDGDGRISSGRELFGSATLTSSGLARHGFEALLELDANRDGRVDESDPQFASLLVWIDDDADRSSAAHELLPLAVLGVRSLNVAHRVQPRCDRLGNCERERSSLLYTDQSGMMRHGALIDVHLRVDSTAAGLCF